MFIGIFLKILVNYKIVIIYERLLINLVLPRSYLNSSVL